MSHSPEVTIEEFSGHGGAQDFCSLASSSQNRRSSLSSRRPLRSSPLAGPALSHSHSMQTDVDLERKSVMYSSPPSPSPVTLSSKRSRTPINLVRFSESLLNRSQARTTNSNASPALQLPTDSAFHQTYNDYPPLSYPPVEPLLPVPALVSALFSTDEVSPLASRPHHRMLSQQSKASNGTIRPPSRNSQSTCKTTPRPSTQVSHTRALPSKSQEGLDNWMTANTYATTPRFSRLGITAPNVILPIPAREYKRVATKRAKLSPGRGLPPKEIMSLESLTTTESSVSSSLETLPLSSVKVPYATSLSEKETIIGGEGNLKVIKAEQSGYSHLHTKRCSSPSSICSCGSMESRIFTGPMLDTVIEGCTEDGFIIGRRKSSVSRPVSDIIGQGETQRGILSKFWKRLAGTKKRCG